MIQKCVILRSRTQTPHFQIEYRTLHPQKSDVVVKTICFSVDPVMKFFLAGAKTYFQKVQIGQIFNCFGLAKVIQGSSSHPTHSYLFGNVGTCTVNILSQERLSQCFPVPNDLVQKYGQFQFVYLINNGLAAFAGYQAMKPKLNQTVVVSTAAGATGLLLCQLLKKKRIKVIGLTSEQKLSKISTNCSIAVNYKNKQELSQILKKQKYSCYFDNVGEQLLDQVIENIEIGGRIALCGAIGNYSSYMSRGIKNYGMIISKRLTLRGITFMSMVSKIYEIFSQFEGVELVVKKISMEQFQQYFTMILSSGSSVVGKLIVQI